ncbi:MAG: hypothetical protein KUG67_03100 [Proteobacteria bacterium]|nr:hypothetical protein [Pseudomonadota bacterium]
MNSAQFKIIRELFHEVGDASASDRARILAERELDPEVRLELELFLEQVDGLDAFQEDQLGSLGRLLIALRLERTDDGRRSAEDENDRPADAEQ